MVFAVVCAGGLPGGPRGAATGDLGFQLVAGFCSRRKGCLDQHRVIP
jgi:hypothetical protein